MEPLLLDTPAQDSSSIKNVYIYNNNNSNIKNNNLSWIKQIHPKFLNHNVHNQECS